MPTKEMALAAAPTFISVRNGTITTTAPENSTATNTAAAGASSIVPCDSAAYAETVLGALSCMSRQHNISIVANIATRSCGPSSSLHHSSSSNSSISCKQPLLFNTAVATGPTGVLLASYRKFHTYGSSPPMAAPIVPVRVCMHHVCRALLHTSPPLTPSSPPRLLFLPGHIVFSGSRGVCWALGVLRHRVCGAATDSSAGSA